MTKDRKEDEKPEETRGIPSLQEVREAALSKVESRYLEDLMHITKRNIKEACVISGLSRSRLYHLLQKYKIGRS